VTRRNTHCGRAAWAALLVASLLQASAVRAEKADREKPINFSANDVTAINYQTKSGALKGNVVVTQGTITIHADRIDIKQNPDSSLSATAYGNPISFREKKDGSDEYYEGFAQRAVYDGATQLLELFDRALLKQGTDEMRSNYISYNNATGVMKAEGRPDQTGITNGPKPRVEGTFQPRGELAPGAKGGAADKGTQPASKAGETADTKAPPAKAAPKAPPLTLKSDDTPAPNAAK
jgi:lipopolysaccharide export system protein LptA